MQSLFIIFYCKTLLKDHICKKKKNENECKLSYKESGAIKVKDIVKKQYGNGTFLLQRTWITKSSFSKKKIILCITNEVVVTFETSISKICILNINNKKIVLK